MVRYFYVWGSYVTEKIMDRPPYRAMRRRKDDQHHPHKTKKKPKNKKKNTHQQETQPPLTNTQIKQLKRREYLSSRPGTRSAGTNLDLGLREN